MRQPYPFSKRRSASSLLACILIFALAAACQSQARSSPTVDATASPPSQPATAPPPTPTDESARATQEPESQRLPEPTARLGSMEGVVIDLPAGWTVESWDEETFQAKLRAGANRQQTGNLAVIRPAVDADTVVLWASRRADPETGTRPAQLLAMTLPRQGLDLADYVDQASRTLGADERISVERAGIVYDIDKQGLPVGIVQYTIDGTTAAREIGGYQIVQFDEQGANMMVLTFTTNAAHLTEELEPFNEIAASIGGVAVP